jgi:RNA-binding protein 25
LPYDCIALYLVAPADSVDKNDADTDKKVVNETERSETGSPDKRKDKERDKDKRDKELKRYDHERERERIRRDRVREREKDHKYREVERLYRDRLKEWEYREREKELQRYNEKEREKVKEHDRRREIMKQEDESEEEDTRKRRRRGSSTLEERKRRRQREKEEDLADRAREEVEIEEARRRAIELQQQADETAAAAAESATLMEVDGDDEKEENEQSTMECDNITNLANGSGAGEYQFAIFHFILYLERTAYSYSSFILFTYATGHAIHKDNNSDEMSMTPGQISDTKQNSSAPTKKLGFGLIGSGKRTSVPSVFAQDDDENNDDKRIRPLVPIDYSTEELQAVQASSEPNIVAAAEFAKRISVANPKEEKTETEKDRGKRSSDKSSQRDRDRNNDDGSHVNDERRERMHDREKDKPKSENNKILDAKQLIDMIPRTKEELFAYGINWKVYDKVMINVCVTIYLEDE